MKPTPSFLDELKIAADHTAMAEDEFRREVAKRAKAWRTNAPSPFAGSI